MPQTTAFGYASSTDGPVHFGLAAGAAADVMEIRWPSGAVQRLAEVAGDRIARVTEPR